LRPALLYSGCVFHWGGGGSRCTRQGFARLLSIMLSFLTYRTINLLIVLAIAGLLATGYYMQYVMYLEPCMLCMSQRLCFMAAGIVALLALLHNPAGRGRTVYGVAGALAALGGAALASRQLWLQSLPEDRVPACGPGFDYVLETFPFLEAVQILIRGDGNCAKVDWTFLGLSIAGWSWIWFAGFVVVFIWQAWRRDRVR
jgi:disulfide bond formation protein DsbB